MFDFASKLRAQIATADKRAQAAVSELQARIIAQAMTIADQGRTVAGLSARVDALQTALDAVVAELTSAATVFDFSPADPPVMDGGEPAAAGDVSASPGPAAAGIVEWPDDRAVLNPRDDA